MTTQYVIDQERATLDDIRGRLVAARKMDDEWLVADLEDQITWQAAHIERLERMTA